MKPLKYLSLLSVSLFYACSPVVVPKNYPKPFEFTLVDSIEGSQSEIFVKANQWLAKTFVSSKSVIQMADKEAGKLIGKAICCEGSSIRYTISIDTKDGKYRCVMSDFYHEGGINSKGIATMSYGTLERPTMHVNGYDFSQVLYKLKNSAMDYSEGLLADLKAFMRSKEKDF